MASSASILKETTSRLGVDFKLMTGILLTENYELDPMSHAGKGEGGKYLYQIVGSTWSKLVSQGKTGGYNYSSVRGQIVGACNLMKDAIALYRGKKDGFNAAIIAYNMGNEGAKAYISSREAGKTNDESVKAACDALLAWAIAEYGQEQGSKYIGDPQYLNKVLKNMRGSLPDTPITDDTTDDEGMIATTFVPLGSFDSKNNQPDTELVISEGLDAVAWFEDPEAIVGNPKLKQYSPVSFTINLREFDNDSALSNSGKPLVVRLNCSLNQVDVSMKHIINKTNSRTGFHMTFWGMEPDTITGSGSTGVFMNQMGVTDFMSEAGKLRDTGALTAVETAYDAKSTVGTAHDAKIAILDKIRNYKEPLRVAAQDAFLELLATFRNNGVIRYRKDNYLPTTSQTIDRTQLQNSVWSEKYGGSSFTRQARVNDVMVKGNVVMNFKSSIYHGYFKSLSWTMDADHPFHWKFDFTFQVQKTISYAYYPIEGR
jgi:hypothetical protein